MEWFGGWVEVNQVSCSISGDLSKEAEGGVSVIMLMTGVVKLMSFDVHVQETC